MNSELQYFNYLKYLIALKPLSRTFRAKPLYNGRQQDAIVRTFGWFYWQPMCLHPAVQRQAGRLFHSRRRRADADAQTQTSKRQKMSLWTSEMRLQASKMSLRASKMSPWTSPKTTSKNRRDQNAPKGAIWSIWSKPASAACPFGPIKQGVSEREPFFHFFGPYFSAVRALHFYGKMCFSTCAIII